MAGLERRPGGSRQRDGGPVRSHPARFPAPLQARARDDPDRVHPVDPPRGGETAPRDHDGDRRCDRGTGRMHRAVEPSFSVPEAGRAVGDRPSSTMVATAFQMSAVAARPARPGVQKRGLDRWPRRHGEAPAGHPDLRFGTPVRVDLAARARRFVVSALADAPQRPVRRPARDRGSRPASSTRNRGRTGQRRRESRPSLRLRAPGAQGGIAPPTTRGVPATEDAAAPGRRCSTVPSAPGPRPTTTRAFRGSGRVTLTR